MIHAHEVKCSYEGSLVAEKSPVDEVRGSAIFCYPLDRRNERTGHGTFSVAIHFCELKQSVGVVRLCAQEMVETLRICEQSGRVCEGAMKLLTPRHDDLHESHGNCPILFPIFHSPPHLLWFTRPPMTK